MVDVQTKYRIFKWAESESLVASAYIFGSRARNDHHQDSDIDIAVTLNKPAGDENCLATWICEGKDLEARLSQALPEFEVDLQFLDGDNTPTVADAVNEAGQIIYAQ